VILGLTGSIGMGKSTASAALRRLGVPVFDADATVHRLLEPGGAAVAAVAAAFPDARRHGGIDRRRLGDQVFGDAAALRRLEAVIHPLVRQAQRRFLAAAARRRCALVALDIPLLLETGGEREVDLVVVVSAPAVVQRGRALRRPGMTAAKLARISARQLDEHEKRRRADVVIPTGLGRDLSLRRLKRLVKVLRRRRRADSVGVPAKG
jgi:dephospho-CoA kinase